MNPVYIIHHPPPTISAFQDVTACKAAVNVGFILDSSGSLRNDYQNEKNFLKKLVEEFDISKDGSRASVLTFR